MEITFSELINVLDVTQLDSRKFQGLTIKNGLKRVFGGQVLGQAVAAAYKTVSNRDIHSLHAYFLREGDVECPIDIIVEETRNGRSFSVRETTAMQRGSTIFKMTCSFQVREQGLEYQNEAPQKIIQKDHGPLSNPTKDDQVHNSKSSSQLFPFSTEANIQYIKKKPLYLIRQEDDNNKTLLSNSKHSYWIRAAGNLEVQNHLQGALLAFASDIGLNEPSLSVHGLNCNQGNMQVASLDHSMWFHRKFDIKEWLLYQVATVSTSNARGLNLGSYYDQFGQLIASTAQECLMRQRG